MEVLASEPASAEDLSGADSLVNPVPLGGDLRFIPLIVKQLKDRGLLGYVPGDCLANVHTKSEPKAETG